MYFALTTSCIYSDHHLLISKASMMIAQQLKLKELENDDKIDEIARMISGASVTELTRKCKRND